MSKKIIFLALLFLYPVGNTWPMTVQEAVKQALKDNPDLQALRLEKEVVQGRLEKAELPLASNPVIETNLSAKDKPREEGGGKDTNYGLMLSQEFEIAGQRALRIDIAKKELSKIDLGIQDKERGLSFEVKEAFARALAARKKEELAGQVVALQEDLRNFTRIKFQAGEVSGLEVNLAEVELSKSRKDLLLADREFRETRLGLQGLMGARPDMTLDLEGDLVSDVLPFPDKGDLIKPFLSQRPDMKAALIEVDRSKSAIDLANRSLVPNIVLGGFYNRDEMRNDLGFSLSLSLPLFDRKQAEKREAQARAAQARIKQADLERTINRELEETTKAVSSSQKELSLFKKEILDKSLENLTLLNLAYQEGKIGFFNVKQAQKDTIEAQFAYLETLLRARRALNALERAIGGDLK